VRKPKGNKEVNDNNPNSEDQKLESEEAKADEAVGMEFESNQPEHSEKIGVDKSQEMKKTSDVTIQLCNAISSKTSRWALPRQKDRTTLCKIVLLTVLFSFRNGGLQHAEM